MSAGCVWWEGGLGVGWWVHGAHVQGGGVGVGLGGCNLGCPILGGTGGTTGVTRP